MAEKKYTEIVVDDGSIRVPIKNQHGDEIGVFYFHPTDVGIVSRYNEMVADIDKVLEPLENLEIGADGTASDDASAEALAEAEKRLCAALNHVFGGNMAEAFFGSMHPFSPVGGVFYCERAIESVGNFITAQFDVETKKMNKRIAKYVNGYTRGGKP